MSAPTTLGVGLHYNIPASVYHADPCETPSLSSSIAQTLLEQSPAHAALKHPRISPGTKLDPSKRMRFGSSVHAVLSGDESEIVVGEFKDFKKDEARDWKALVIASGRVPMLRHEMDSQTGTVNALISKAGNGCDNKPFVSHGQSEVTVIWKEGEIYCRARFDRLVISPDGFTADIWDWKVTGDVSDESLRRRIEDGWYFMRAAFYLRGLHAVIPSISGRGCFFWTFVEDKAPHAVRRVPLCESWRHWGNIMSSRAIDMWSGCLKSGNWSDPLDGLTRNLLPNDWFTRKMEEAA